MVDTDNKKVTLIPMPLFSKVQYYIGWGITIFGGGCALFSAYYLKFTDLPLLSDQITTSLIMLGLGGLWLFEKGQAATSKVKLNEAEKELRRLKNIPEPKGISFLRIIDRLRHYNETTVYNDYKTVRETGETFTSGKK